MLLDNFCPPALLYIAFSITHIIIDTVKGFNNTAIIKFLVMIVFTVILNLLCSMGLSMLSWFIVFIPFIMMTIVSSVLLFTFGLSPSSGKLNYNIEYPKEHSHKQTSDIDTNYNGHTHTYYKRKQPMNYNTYPRGSYGHQTHLDRNYYTNSKIHSAYAAAAEKAAADAKASAAKATAAAAKISTDAKAAAAAQQAAATAAQQAAAEQQAAAAATAAATAAADAALP